MKFALLFSLLTISQLAFSDYKVLTKTHGKQEFIEQEGKVDLKTLPQQQQEAIPQKTEAKPTRKTLYRKGL